MLEVRYKGSVLKGRFVSASGNSMVLKMENGYNVSIPLEEAEIIREEKFEPQASREAIETFGSGEKRIMMLHTGGTIASRVDYVTGAVTPVKDLRFLAPGLRTLEKKFTVDSMVIDNVLSENMTPENWISMATEINRHMKDYDGIVLTHGTDTMTYSGSALAFMFEQQAAPVVLTGSQRSSDRPSSDAFHNLEGAVQAAGQNIGEVCISFHSNASDKTINILRATRSRKMHSSRRDAISSVGSGLIAKVSGGKVEMAGEFKKRDGKTVLKKKIDKNVLLYYFSPLSDPDGFLQLADSSKVAVIMGTGLGHIGERFLKPIKQLTDSGKEVIITTQTIYGEVNLDVYSTGRKLQKAGAFSVGRMLPEVAAVKSMWVLANYPVEKFREIMNTNIRGEKPEREIFERT